MATKDDRVRSPSDEERLVLMLKALGNPIRFQIMRTLAERQTCITQEIVDSTPLAQSTVSQHLKVLRDAGLVLGEVEGPATCYCLDVEGVRWLKDQIEGWLPGCCDLDEVREPGNLGRQAMQLSPSGAQPSCRCG